MTDELASVDPAMKGPADEAAATAVSTSTYFMAKNGTSVLSDEAKYPTEALETVAAGLYSTIGLLLKVFASYSTDEQLQRMGPTLASLTKTLHQKVRFVNGTSLKGGANGDSDTLWEEAFGLDPKRGGNGSTSAAIVPAAPAAPGALGSVASADPAAVVAQAQARLLDAQAGLVEAHMKERQAASDLTNDRAELARQILRQASPLTTGARESRAVIYSVVVEGALVGLFYIGGKGLAGLGLASAVVLIQVYSAVSAFQVSKVLSGLGSAVGAGIFSVGTGLGGAVLNTISGILGMGSVTESIQLPSELSPSDEPMVLVEGRGFTPGVKLPPPPADFPEIKALAEIQNLTARIEFFINRLLAAFFGESDPTQMNAVYFCVASVTFILLYYFIGHLIDIMDEVRTRRKIDIANAVELRTQLPAPAAPGLRALLGMAAPAAPGSALPLMGGKKKRRTFRNNTKRRTTRQKKGTKVLGAPVFIY